MCRVGDTVSLNGPGLYEGHQRTGSLVVDAPADACIVIHASYTAAQIRDTAGPGVVIGTGAALEFLSNVAPDGRGCDASGHE
jgi:hypothetical protein